jgi:hypothetical protein
VFSGPPARRPATEGESVDVEGVRSGSVRRFSVWTAE